MVGKQTGVMCLGEQFGIVFHKISGIRIFENFQHFLEYFCFLKWQHWSDLQRVQRTTEIYV